MGPPKASARNIIPISFLGALVAAMPAPVLPDIFQRLDPDPVLVAHYVGYFIATYAVLQFLVSPILGSLSDRFGRRTVLLVSQLGSSIDYLFMAFAPNVPLLFVGRIISGLTGARVAVLSSYLGEVSTDSNRSANFGMLGATAATGMTLGPLIGGLLARIDTRMPFVGCGLITLANFVWTYFRLAESLPPEKRRTFEKKHLNPFSSLIGVLNSPSISMYIWAYFLAMVTTFVYGSTYPLYMQYRFNWTGMDIGLSLGFFAACAVIAQGGLVGPIIRRIGESRTLGAGLCLQMFGLFALGLGTRPWIVYAVLALVALGMISQTAFQSLIVKGAPPNRLGELQGSMASMNSLGGMVGPVLFTYLFTRFTSKDASFLCPGMPFLMASCVSLGSLVLAMIATRVTTASDGVVTLSSQLSDTATEANEERCS